MTLGSYNFFLAVIYYLWPYHFTRFDFFILCRFDLIFFSYFFNLYLIFIDSSINCLPHNLEWFIACIEIISYHQQTPTQFAIEDWMLDESEKYLQIKWDYVCKIEKLCNLILTCYMPQESVVECAVKKSQVRQHLIGGFYSAKTPLITRDGKFLLMRSAKLFRHFLYSSSSQGRSFALFKCSNKNLCIFSIENKFIRIFVSWILIIK